MNNAENSIGVLPAPISPEEEPKKGFQVKIEQPDLIFKAAKEGKSGQLGKQLLEKPLRNVEVGLISGKENFDIFTKLDTDLYTNILPGISYNDAKQKIFSTMISSYSDAKEKGERFIFTGKRGTKFIIGSGGYTDIEISTGTITENNHREQIFPGPTKTTESINAALLDLADILKTSTESFYKLTGKEPPDDELILHPPKEQIGQPGGISAGELFPGKLRERTPENLAGKLEIERPDISFKDIGGQEAAKRELEGLSFALKNPDLYRKHGTKPPKGIVLYGPPGTGKTLMAKALAAEAGARFFHVEASDIASKYYGESEQTLKNIFDLAGQNGEKTIIFFDEIDAIAPKREGAHEATQRTVSTLLTNMDGMESKDNVIVVASTNRLDNVDSALLRSGRLDRWVEVGLPDKEGRKQIFDIHTQKAQKNADAYAKEKTDTAVGEKLFEDLNFETILAKTENANGADIAEIIRRTLEEKVRQEGTTGEKQPPANTEDILKQIEQYEKISKVKKTLTSTPDSMYI